MVGSTRAFNGRTEEAWGGGQMKQQEFGFKPSEEQNHHLTRQKTGLDGLGFSNKSSPSDRSLRCLFDLQEKILNIQLNTQNSCPSVKKVRCTWDHVIAKTEIRTEKGQVQAQSFGILHSFQELP